MPAPIPIVKRAADKFGSLAAFARAIGIKHPSLYNWRQIPSKRVLQIERLTGIPREELRPDLYPRKKR